MSSKFIHCADLHLDSPMRGLRQDDGAVKFCGATRSAFEKLVDCAIERQVAFVVVSGDVFDGDWNDYATAIWAAEPMNRLKERKIPVLIAYGNHDRKNKFLANVRWPENVCVFDADVPRTYVYPDDFQYLWGADVPKAAQCGERVALVGQRYAVFKLFTI
ncbi:MAG: metallophosphoesterase [Thermoguttaceae bacterium]|nr:metallophosphoesterase [Thermoguttaceae bacterium]